MACPAIITGDQFLVRVMAHIDCQAQVIGSYGYQALGEPGSVASLVVTGLLTLFVAFFGIRLMFGPAPGARDLVFDVLKIGIVLSLAFSWPAFRTVVYDVTLKAPAEVANVVSTSSANASPADFPNRLQQADNAIKRLTSLGTGRTEGQFIDSNEPGSTFAGTALQDDSAMGFARLLYLSGIIGTLALLRIAAGLLLALAPLAAALLFFHQTRGIFAGWVKGLVFTVAGSIGATIILGVELAIIEPWLADALRVRSIGYATPSAPTELFAIMLAFAIVQIAMLALLARVTFYRGWLTMPQTLPAQINERVQGNWAVASPLGGQIPLSQTERISRNIETSIRRDQTLSVERLLQTTSIDTRIRTNVSRDETGQTRLGSSFRRPAHTPSRSTLRRDKMR